MMIESKRLLLRSWRSEDVGDLTEGLNNINVSKWLAGVPYPYTENHASYFIEYAKGRDEGSNIFLAIVLKETGKVIGGTDISIISRKDGIGGGGIWLNEEYHGNGYGTEAFGAKIKYAFDVLGLRRMENGYFPGNKGSWKMQEKLGYRYEGLRRKRLLCPATNEYMDECMTGLLKEEFVGFGI